MKKKILIGSSSFLLPNNSSWNILENKYTLGFADYGNYNEIFGNKNVNKVVCFHLFFEDLNNSKNIKEKLNFI